MAVGRGRLAAGPPIVQPTQWLIRHMGKGILSEKQAKHGGGRC